MEPLDPDRNLAERLGAAVDDLDASPDLAGVLAGADRRRRRSRSFALGGAAAVVALGVGGIVLVSNRDTDELPAAQPDPVVVPLTTLPQGPGSVDAEPGATGAPGEETADPEPAADQVPVSTIRLDAGVQPDPNAADPADAYLDQTEEIYRREMPSGYDLQIRRSTASYGDLFGIEWDLPTGSQAECLGSPAVFIGDPAAPREWLSSWTVGQWSPIGDAQDFEVSEQYRNGGSKVLIRTDLPAVDAAIVLGSEVIDSAPFIGGISALEMSASAEQQGYEDSPGPMLSISVEAATRHHLPGPLARRRSVRRERHPAGAAAHRGNGLRRSSPDLGGAERGLQHPALLQSDQCLRRLRVTRSTAC